jgi:enoyl-CoA hydratase/carnithine racemase
VPADEILTVRLPATGEDALWAMLADAGRQLTGAVRLVIVRGAGMDFFDGTAPRAAAAAGLAAAVSTSDAVGWLRRPDLVSVAAISGRATGAGLDIAMACDLRVVASDAELAASAMNDDPERTLGLGIDTVARLGDVLGYSRALEFVTTTRGVSGRQAAALGLANLAVDPAALDTALEQLIEAVLKIPRTTVTTAKAVLAAADVDRRRRTDDLAAGLRLAAGET